MQADQLNVIRITNPFNPREFVTETLAWEQSRTLATYFPIGTAESVVSLNGKIIPREDFDLVYPAAGDSLVICPVPEGGGGNNKNIFSVVAMLAVSFFAPVLAGAIAPSLGIGAGLGMNMLTVGITMAGSMLVHSIFAPSATTNTNAQNATVASYGIDGAKNTSLEGVPVPICFGKFRMAGNIIDLFVENEGDTQNLFVLINCGEGPVISITDIELNGNPVSDYKDVEVAVRGGTNDQPVIPWFSNTVVPFSVNGKLTQNWTTYTTNGEVDRLRLDFVAPNGLFQVDKSTGEARQVSVPLEMQIRPLGSSNWSSMALQNIVTGSRNVVPIVGTAVGDGSSPTAGGYQQDELGNVWFVDAAGVAHPATDTRNIVTGWMYEDSGSPVSGADLAYIRDNYNEQLAATSNGSWTVPTYGASADMISNKRSAVRRSYDSGQLISDKYEVRARRTTPKSADDTVSDEVYLSDVNEIILAPMTYPNTALLGLKIKLGEQISGLPTITYMHGGKVIPVYGKPVSSAAKQWYWAASSNPAWIVWNILTDQFYGGGMSTARLDFPAFQRLADYCDGHDLKWNGPIDTEMNVWDACQYVLRVAHSQLVNVGTRWTVVSEAPAEPVMMFSVANMLPETYKETWLPVSDRANEIDVTFFDEQDSYKQRTIRVYDPSALANGAKQRTSAVTLYGITKYDRAYQEGMFAMNLNRFIQKTINFSAPVEALACTVGDVILVQNDMTDWAEAGRFAAGSTTTVMQLDRPVTMEAGKAYRLLAMQDTVMVAGGAISNIVGNIVFLSGYSGQNCQRLAAGGMDKRITACFNGSVEVEDTAGLAAGQAYISYLTDVIEERGVFLSVGQTSTPTLTEPLSQPARQYSQWMFGEATKAKQPFRIKSIDNTTEFVRNVTAIQYDARVFDYTRFASQHVPIANPADAVIGQVRNLELYEETRIAGDQIISEVIGSWRPPHTGMYAGADIYVRRNAEAGFTNIGSVNHRNSVEIDAKRGDVVTVKVVAFDIYGKRALFDPAPEVQYKVIGEIKDIDVGDVTGADLIWNGRDCRLTWRYNSTTHSYEFGSEPAGADSGSLDPQFKDYEIRVYGMGDDVLKVQPRRVEHVADNSYTYTFDKNHVDGLTRRLKFEIRMRDKFNNLGKPTTLTAYNPPPRLTGFSATPTFESANLRYEHTNDPDFAGALVWLSDQQVDVSYDYQSAEITPFLIYVGPDTSIPLMNLMFEHDYYVRVACFDVFGHSELIPSTVLHFRTTNFDVEAIADGVIGESKLLLSLQERINLVDGPASLAGSVAQRLLNEALARQAAIEAEQTIRQTADESLASSMTTFTASLNANAAAIQNESTVRATADSALADQINIVAASASGNRVYRGTTAPTAPAGGFKVNDVWYNAGDNNKPYLWNGSSWQVTDDPRIQANTAAIAVESQARADADTAQANQYTTLTSTVNGNTTTLQQTMSTVGGLMGQYTVKIDTNGYVAGFGFASETTQAGQTTSEFGIRTDKMYVVLPGYPAVHPFTIGVVNGVPRVIMSNALIGDATIGSAHIGNLVVNTSNINVGATSDAFVGQSGSTVADTYASTTLVVPPNCQAAHIIVSPGMAKYVSTGSENNPSSTSIGSALVNVDIAGLVPTPPGGYYGTYHLIVKNPSAGNYFIQATRQPFANSGFTDYVGTPISVLAIAYKR